jgi:hypothetical protein
MPKNNLFHLQFQSQLLLVRANGMQVGAAECRFIRSYLWFEAGAGRS